MYTHVDSWSRPKNSIIHTVHFQNNQHETLRCIIFSIWWKALWKVVQTVMNLRGPLFAELRKQIKIQNYMSWWSSRSSKVAFFLILHNWERVHTKASSKIKTLGRSVSQRRMPRETEKPPLTMIDEKPTDGTSTSKKDQDGHGMMKSGFFLNGRRRIEDFFVKMVMEWWVFIFLVYDGVRREVYIHSPVARTFFCAQRVHCVLRTHRHACHTHAWLTSAKRVLCTCVFVLYLAISVLMIHLSLQFLHGHFETTPDYDFTDDPVHAILPCFPVLKAQDTRHSAPASRSLAHWPSQMQTQVMSPPSSTRSLLWMMTRRSSTIRTTISPTSPKPRTRTLENSLFTQYLNPLFRTFFMMILLFGLKSKESMQSGNRCLTERERKEKVSWSVMQSRCQRKVNGTVSVWFWSLSENSILMDEIFENIFNEELNMVLLVIQFRENYMWMSTTWRSKIQSEEIQNTHYSSHKESLNFKDNNYWKPINGQIKLNVREYMCVANWRWRTIFIKKAMQEVAEKLKNWEYATIQKEITTKTTTKIGRISYAAWSGITNSESSLLRSWLKKFGKHEQLWHTYVSPLGDASAKIPWPNGISKLDREFPSWSLRKGEESRARIAVDQGNRSSQLAEGLHQSEIKYEKRFLWVWRIGFDDGDRIEMVLRYCLFDLQHYRVWSRDKQKGENSYTERKTKECFQRDLHLGCSRRDVCSFHFEQAYSSVPKVKKIDGKALNGLKASPATKSRNNPFLLRARWKISSCDCRHHPVCRGYKSGNRCIYGYHCWCRQADGKSNLSARSKSRYSRISCYSERKSPRLCNPRLRSNEFYSTESWRIGIERFGGTHQKFSGCTWYKKSVRKGQSGGIIQKGEPHERNPCALVFEEQPFEETSRQADCTVVFGQKICKLKLNIKLRFILCEGARHRRSYVWYGFGSFDAQCWAKEIWAQIQWILWEGPKTPHATHRDRGQCK